MQSCGTSRRPQPMHCHAFIVSGNVSSPPSVEIWLTFLSFAAGGHSLNNFVRSQQQRLRYRQAECLGSLGIDDELELQRGLDGELVWRGTLENPIGIGRRA